MIRVFVATALIVLLSSCTNDERSPIMPSDFANIGPLEIEVVEGKDAFELAISSLESASARFVLGGKKDIEGLTEQQEFDKRSFSEILAATEDIDVQEWFMAKEKREEELLADYDLSWQEVLGEWQGESEEKMPFVSNKDLLTMQVLDQVAIGTIRLSERWHVLPHLKYGGWNECPSAEVHGAIWKYWQEKYGAIILAVTSDVVEATVQRPPVTKEEAMLLAKEQYLYCNDIVDQGTQTVSALASTLINQDKWYFWWD